MIDAWSSKQEELLGQIHILSKQSFSLGDEHGGYYDNQFPNITLQTTKNFGYRLEYQNYDNQMV